MAPVGSFWSQSRWAAGDSADSSRNGNRRKDATRWKEGCWKGMGEAAAISAEEVQPLQAHSMPK